jgi:hypothetical protein
MSRIASDLVRLRSFVLLLILGSIGVASVEARANQPDFDVGRAEYPTADAIVLRLEQHWELDRFGKMHRREHSWVKLLDRRAIGRYADPRIDWNYRTDDVIIRTARTHVPDGTLLPVPDYSFNVAAPSDVAGWPEWAEWRQTVVSFSGVQADAVLELDYEVVTQQGAIPWLSADLRLNEDDPIVERFVTLTVPESTPVLQRIDNLAAAAAPRKSVGDEGSVTYTWSFGELAAAPSEPQSPPWQSRCGRVRFTTCPDAEAWIDSYLEAVKHAIRPDPRVAAFAEEAIGDVRTPHEKIEKLTTKLRDSFNIVTSRKTTQSRRARRTPYVYDADYGSPLEAAALLIAMCRDVGFDASPAVAVDARFWNAKVPTDSAFEAVVARVETPDGLIIAHPRQGIIDNPGGRGRRLLLWTDENRLESQAIPARGDSAGSRIECTGRVKLAADGSATAELELTLTGLCFDPGQLQSTEAQRRLASRVIKHVLDGFEIVSMSVVTLSDDAFTADVALQTDGPLPDVAGDALLTLGDGPAILEPLSLPIARSTRRTEVELPGRCSERIDLAIVLPEGAEALVLPASLAEIAGPFGTIEQNVSFDGSTIRWLREIHFDQDRISQSEYGRAREAISDLLSDSARRVVWTLSPD